MDILKEHSTFSLPIIIEADIDCYTPTNSTIVDATSRVVKEVC